MAELIAIPIMISSSAFKSYDELMVERMANQIISLSAKIALLILDPKQRPPMPKREDVIDFFEHMNAVSERNIHKLEGSVKMAGLLLLC